MLLLCASALGGLTLLAAAVTARRGQVCVRGVGYSVPARVEADPDLDRRANELVAFWCTGGAILSVPPLVVLVVAVVGRRDDLLDLPGLLVLAGYGFALACIAAWPFARIQDLGADRTGRGR